MTDMRTKVAGAVAALILGIGLAGCGGGDETVVATDDGTVSVDQDENRIEIETDEGSATITGQGSGELPDGWPSEVAVPEGATITGGMAMTGQDQKGWTASLSFPDASAKDVMAQFASSLEDAGFTTEGTYSSEDSSVSSFTSDSYQVSVLVAAEGSGSIATVTVSTTQ